MLIQKRFRSAYILDEAKLRRIIDVIEQAFSETGSNSIIRFEANHKQRKVTIVNSLEQLLLLDNSKKHPIESLRIVASAENPEGEANDSPTNYGEVFFDDADMSVSVEYKVSSLDSKWTNNCSSLLVEQIERTLQTSWFAKLNGNPMLRTMIGLLLMTMLLVIPVMFLAMSRSLVSAQMWLTDSDIIQITESNAPIVPADVLKMQIKNIQEYKSRKSWLRDWRIYAASSPVIVVLICFLYLAFKCYPPTVFNWGDMGEHFEALLGKRRILWSAVVLSVFVGVLANLAVYGLADLVRN